MARLMTVTEQRQVTDERRKTLTLDDVPAHLRRSAHLAWLDNVGHTPVSIDELDAAYRDNGHEPNPWADEYERESFDTGPLYPHWRSEVAQQRHHDAYIEWLQERGLIDERGCALAGWRWSDLTHREAQQ